jgi:signal transduction histidine kinase
MSTPAQSTTSLAARLRAIPVFAAIPDDRLEWLASQMQVTSYAPGEALIRENEPADRMMVLLQGEIRGIRENDSNGGFTFTAQAGAVTGKLPYSRMERYRITARALVPTTVATLHEDRFPEMLAHVPDVAAKLVNVLADRVREFTRVEQQNEKLMALGKLSAGLAHELNNPASAARRAAESLRESICSVRTAAVDLEFRDLAPEQRRYLAELERSWEDRNHAVSMDTLDRSDREQEIGGWLEERGLRDAWTLAPGLVDAGCDLAILKDLESRFDRQALAEVITRLAGAFTISRLSKEIESSTARISELVRAIKEYSYMDQMPEQEIDIHNGIENTLIMLRHRLKQGIQVVRDYDRSIPPICAYGSELNQVWTNLIENAIDAMDGKGELRVTTRREPANVRVEIRDNGPGIPPEIHDRVFEPFFTTKPVGKGTGLGLDTVYRIVRKHRGEITVESKPGDTRFQVLLPVARP